jgi:hypothetical protein
VQYKNWRYTVKCGVLNAVSTLRRCRMPSSAVFYAVIKVSGEKGKENGK